MVRRADRGDGATAAFAAHVRSEVDPATLRTALVTTANDAVRPVEATVWLRATREARG